MMCLLYNILGIKGKSESLKDLIQLLRLSPDNPECKYWIALIHIAF